MSLSQDQTKVELGRSGFRVLLVLAFFGALFQRLDCLSLFLLVRTRSPLGREITY